VLASSARGCLSGRRVGESDAHVLNGGGGPSAVGCPVSDLDASGRSKDAGKLTPVAVALRTRSRRACTRASPRCVVLRSAAPGRRVLASGGRCRPRSGERPRGRGARAGRLRWWPCEAARSRRGRSHRRRAAAAPRHRRRSPDAVAAAPVGRGRGSLASGTPWRGGARDRGWRLRPADATAAPNDTRQEPPRGSDSSAGSVASSAPRGRSAVPRGTATVAPRGQRARKAVVPAPAEAAGPAVAARWSRAGTTAAPRSPGQAARRDRRNRSSTAYAHAARSRIHRRRVMYVHEGSRGPRTSEVSAILPNASSPIRRTEFSVAP
jgi:hypothetical protein